MTKNNKNANNPSNSSFQTEMEKTMRDWFNKERQINTAASECYLANGKRWYKINLDGLDSSYAIEIYSHQGKLAAAQEDKVASDILKLSLINRRRKVFISTPSVIDSIKNKWIGYAAEQYDVELVKYHLSDEEKKELSQAQTNQDITK